MDEDPCDIVDDGGVGIDVQQQGFIALFVSAAVSSEVIANTINVNTVDSAAGAIAVTDAFGMLVSDSAVGASALQQTLSAVQLLLAAASMADTVPPLIGNTVAAAATASDASTHSVAHEVSAGARLSDALNLAQTLSTLVARSAVARAATMQVLAEFQAEAATGAGTAVGTLRAFDLSTAAGVGSDAQQLAQTLAQTLADRAAGSDAREQAIDAVNLIAVDGFGEGEPIFDAGTAWTALLDTWAMSQWLNLPGDSIGVADGRWLIGGDGIFTEDAPDQQAAVDLGISDMGSAQLKRLSYAYWHGQITGSVTLQVGDHDGGTEQLWPYEFAAESGTQWEPMRTRLGRGHRSRNFRLEVQPSGVFEMAEIRILHDATARKV